MHEGQLFTSTSLSVRSQTQNCTYVLFDSISLKFKNPQNSCMLLEVMIMDLLGGGRGNGK